MKPNTAFHPTGYSGFARFRRRVNLNVEPVEKPFQRLELQGPRCYKHSNTPYRE
jgi:hypothetical protein